MHKTRITRAGALAAPGGHAALVALAALADRCHDASMVTGMAGPAPVVWGTDAVFGANHVYGAMLYPRKIGLGAAQDPDAVRCEVLQ